jgi:hypothetical protein
VSILKRRLELSRRLVEEERVKMQRDDSILDGLFGIEESTAKKRERNEREIEHLNKALTVRRERRWSTAGDKPARELDRSTR